MVLLRLKPKLRHIYRHSCKYKKAYSFFIAILKTVEYKLQRGVKVIPYKCYFCNSWHVGHLSNGAKRNNNRFKHLPRITLLNRGNK